MLRARATWSVVAVVGFTIASASTLGGERLAWQDDMTTAEELSLKHGRPLLIYVTTASCPFCRKMEQKTWADEAVNERLQNTFVPLRLDADKYPELVARLGVKGFPTTLIYGNERKLLGHFVGYAPPDRVLQTLDQLLGKPGLQR